MSDQLQATVSPTKASFKGRAHHLISAGNFVAAIALWYVQKPDPGAIPVLLAVGVLGYSMGRGVSRELTDQLKSEIEYRNREIDRIAASRSKLEEQYLSKRGSSRDKAKGKSK